MISGFATRLIIYTSSIPCIYTLVCTYTFTHTYIHSTNKGVVVFLLRAALLALLLLWGGAE